MRDGHSEVPTIRLIAIRMKTCSLDPAPWSWTERKRRNFSLRSEQKGNDPRGGGGGGYLGYGPGKSLLDRTG